MLIVLIMLVVAFISMHVTGYGWYALREEKNLYGALGAFAVAGATFGAPVLLLLYYTFWLD